MYVLFINNNGGGFADKVWVEEGTTLAQFLARQMRGDSLSNYLIRHNNDKVVAGDQLLRDGDKVSATPVKIEGAVN
jgi:hypothetical protein